MLIFLKCIELSASCAHLHRFNSQSSSIIWIKLGKNVKNMNLHLIILSMVFSHFESESINISPIYILQIMWLEMPETVLLSIKSESSLLYLSSFPSHLHVHARDSLHCINAKLDWSHFGRKFEWKCCCHFSLIPSQIPAKKLIFVKANIYI